MEFSYRIVPGSGAIECYTIVNGEFTRRIYLGYELDQALELFREELKFLERV
jgi:hypothetical protein